MVAFNPRKPNIARIYDVLRDGKDNFGPDREAADAIRTMAADGQRAAHDNRAFLARTVRYLIREQGIRQFIDIGSGMPADQNTHEITRNINEAARTAYIDNDPVVTGHAKAVLEDKLTSIALTGDLRNPRNSCTIPDCGDSSTSSSPSGSCSLPCSTSSRTPSPAKPREPSCGKYQAAAA